MEPFALAAISLTISISLLIKKKRRAIHLSFALLCFAIFLQKGGSFFHGIINNDFWQVVSYIGLLAIPPLLITFSRIFMERETLLRRRIIVSTTFSSLLIIGFFFTPLFRWSHFNIVLYLYAGFIMVYCYTVLIISIKEKESVVEKKRLIYVATACAVTAVISISDILHHYGYGLPPLSDIAEACLIYFVLVIITYPNLPEFYEIMARALIVLIITISVIIVFYLIIGLFGGTPDLPVTHVLMASFIIVIFIDPVKLILKKTVSHLFFEGRDVFTSLYSIDEKLEMEKSMLLEEMAFGLAHEIRNPLGSIKGAAQCLRPEVENLGNRKLLDVITEEVDRLNNVVSQFLNYAKPYTIKAKMQDINRIVEKAISLIKASNPPENIVIRKNLMPDLPDQKVDGEQVMQVILNIAYNGIEAMPQGGILTFTTSKKENRGKEIIEIAIQDTGHGIEDKDMKNIFKPFYTTKDKGIGLGLPLCKRIIERHGGDLELKSSPRQGTTFYIRIGGLP